jgi:hypothetical protein
MGAVPGRSTQSLERTMSRVLGYRIATLTIGALTGVGVPLLVLGPFVIHDLSLAHASNREIAVATAFLLLGLWFVVLAFFAEGNVIEDVVSTFSIDAAFLLLPYLIFVMSRSLFGRIIGRKGRDAP